MPRFNYVFSIITASRITAMCTTLSETTTGLPLYLYNKDYPSHIRPTDTSCSCSVETARCASQVNVYFVHFELADGRRSCTGTQKIKITDNETDQTFTCSENTYNTITLKMTSSSNYLTISLDNSAGTADGYFWIGFEGRHEPKSAINSYIEGKYLRFLSVCYLKNKLFRTVRKCPR